MAEDKRIRVSADTTPLQEVRQAARELWEDLAQMETNFKQINDGVLQSIQKQIDLLKERNSLYTAFNPQEQTNTQQGQNNRNAGLIDPYTGRPLFDKTEGQGIRNADFEKALNVLDKISSDVTRIAETLEQDQRNQQNGLVPGEGSQPAPLPNPAGGNPLQPPQQPNAPTGGRGRGFSLPTSLQGMMSLLPYGAALFGIGQMIGQQFQFQAMQYGAQNEFQRRNNVGKNPLLNMLSFGITGAKADEAEVGRLAAEQNDKVLKDYSALFGVSYNESLRRQITGSFGGNYNNLFDQTIGAPKSRSDSYIRVSEGGDTSRVVTGDKTRAEEANKAAGISKEEFQNWASTVLGLNITEFTEKSQVYPVQGQKVAIQLMMI